MITEIASINFSRPKPIITAEKVPPKTIISGGKRKSARNEPPSIKNAPNIENIPNPKPMNAPYFNFISNPEEI